MDTSVWRQASGSARVDATAVVPARPRTLGRMSPSTTEWEHYRVEDLARRRTAKWATHPRGVLAAWVADMDFPAAPAVRAALAELIGTDQTGYPSTAMVDEVRAAFVERMATRHQWTPDPERVELLSDVVQGIAWALWTLTEPGDGVLVHTPAYPPFLSVVAATGRRLVEMPLAVHHGVARVDPERLVRTVRDHRVRALVLCSPHNPTGRVWTSEELAEVAEVAEAEDLVVVADEIHADIVYGGHRHHPFATVSDGAGSRTVTLTSASKAFNLAGLRCAVAVLGSSELHRRWRTLPDAVRGGLSSPGLVATAAAWRAGDRWLEGVVGYLEGNRDLVARAVADGLPGAVHRPPEGTYLSWIDLSAYDLGEDPAAWLLEHGSVALSSGPTFGAPGIGHVRLNFATPRPVLATIVDRLVEMVADRPGRP